MRTVRIGGVEVGAGAPKVLVPIVARTAEEVALAGRVCAAADCDVVEWRADCCPEALDERALPEALARLREALRGKPALFTIRTRPEGGEAALPPEAYAALNAVAARGADAVDIELFCGGKTLRRCVDAVHAAGKPVVLSSHDFARTPPRHELIRRMRAMQDAGADVCKLAVMPQSAEDVLTLLAATAEMTRLYADRPIVTVSMSPLGVISRVCGELTGSAMTYGAVGEASAPGQMPVERLNETLRLLHEAMDGAR